MVNKQWLIKLTGEDNLFYDSEEKVYRYRNHCPHCGAVSGCQCFHDLETAEEATAEGLDYCCSSKCALIYNKEEGGIEDEDAIFEAMRELKIQRNISELTYLELVRLIEELDKREKEEIRSNEGRLKGRELSSERARIELGYISPVQMLMADQIAEILQLVNSEGSLLSDEESGDIYELMVDLGINKKVEDVTEEEAQQILNLCEFDGDAPMGESCNS